MSLPLVGGALSWGAVTVGTVGVVRFDTTGGGLVEAAALPADRAQAGGVELLLFVVGVRTTCQH